MVKKTKKITESVIHDFKGYQGNPLVKSRGSIEWTPELMMEYIRCSQDPIYFCENYMQVIHVDRGLVPLQLYDYQKTMIRMMNEHRNCVFTCARQAGKTTSFVGFICWYIIFHPDKQIGILANKAATAREILGRIRLAYMNLPQWLQQNVREWAKSSVILENNSRIIADSTTSDSVRGYSFSMLVIDEAAHIDNWDEFFTSVYPTVSSGNTTKVVLVSTPNGLNHFYDTFLGATFKDSKDPTERWNGYESLLVTWDQVPGRDEAWRQKTLKSLNFDEAKFDQEYNCEFAGSSGTLISGQALKSLRPAAYIMAKDGLIQYKTPQPGRIYLLVADTSHGKGLDYSAFSIFDITEMPYDQVCTFRSNTMTPLDYAEYILRTAQLYNNCYVLPELNDLGQQVSDSLFMDFEYEFILMTGSAPGMSKRVSEGFGGTRAERGIRTTKSVKAVGCSVLKLLIEQKSMIINDVQCIYELSRFSKKGKSYEAEPGVHDDTVMCLVLFAWLTAQEFFKELTDINTLAQLREISAEQMEAEMLPFGFHLTGAEETPVETQVRQVQDWLGWD